MIEKIAANNTSCIEDLHEDMEQLETIVRVTNKGKKANKKTTKKSPKDLLSSEAIEDDSSDGRNISFAI